MTDISATLVKTLREKTGAGVMACRTTLAETGGNLDAAIERLRDAQTTMAAKKGDRVATEGLVGLATAGGRGALVELNCETDFVARSDAFRQAASALARVALDVDGDLEALRSAASPDGDGRVSDLVTRLTARTGERVRVRRCAYLSVIEGQLVPYVHNAVAPGVGSIATLVALETRAPAAVVAGFGRHVAMHIAASAPRWVSSDDIPAEVTSEKRAELLAQARTSGKPDGVVEKMVEGRLRKFADEVALRRQPFIMDPDRTVAEAIEEAARAAGEIITVRAFARFKVGEPLD